MRYLFAIASLVSAPILANGDTAYGRPADAHKAGRSVRIEMTDQMRFRPTEISIKRGEVVRFEAVNQGLVMHELVLDTMEGLKKHAEHMKAHGGMQHHEPNAVHVAPGKTGTLGWQFTKAGVFYYGCLVPGHFEAGMVGKVVVK